MKLPLLKSLIPVSTLALAAAAHAEEWDLSSLPHYQPRQQVSGTIRMGGAQMAGLVAIWEKAFQQRQPGIKFANELPSSDVAMAGMIMGTADIAPCGREPALEEILGFTEKYSYDVTPIVVGSGAWNTPGGSSWSPVVFVSQDNPLTQLTLKQLDGIFGAERTGGYEENSALFVARNARGPDKNIRTWGQLGLTGEWKDKPIQTYGYSHTGMRHFFELRVFGGGDKWNPNYREYAESGTKMVADGSGTGSHDMLVALAHDKYGIGWSGNGHAASVPGLKAIALAKDDGSPYFAPTERNMQTHDYPLSRIVFMYVNRAPGQALDPKVKEFLRFILSQEGQDILAHNGLHLPLPEPMLLAQRKKLE
ncbi:substrate-binding domain-containing protein [Opitutus sp. GAS368]|jgi:phosphate transport system substrate-binding protein|uniref:PstS family phosphate ABC transporter substrate-binding protein n=1 Tax=Opitutus sp. GAS368 TaxID=1882749 RepID=UPI00087B4E2E|nr:substrate-binding domain-containing protein [Opitutus sp. GAS368]SDR90101.1 phosphate transport system substrate-binding protein [Opitutus sp. GAS368]